MPSNFCPSTSADRRQIQHFLFQPDGLLALVGAFANQPGPHGIVKFGFVHALFPVRSVDSKNPVLFMHRQPKYPRSRGSVSLKPPRHPDPGERQIRYRPITDSRPLLAHFPTRRAKISEAHQRFASCV